MAEPAQVLEEIFTVIEGGKDLGEAGKIIQFPSDNGQKVYQAVEMTQQGSNGTGLKYWAAAIASAGSRALSSGAIMLGMEVGVVGAAIAPALGLLSGYVLYNLSPEFWDGVANALIEAGETVKGKVVAYMNENGILTFSEETIEIFKNKFLEAGLFNGKEEWDGDEPETWELHTPIIASERKFTYTFAQVEYEAYYLGITYNQSWGNVISGATETNSDVKVTSFTMPNGIYAVVTSKSSLSGGFVRIQESTGRLIGSATASDHSYTYDNKTVHWIQYPGSMTTGAETVITDIGTNPANYVSDSNAEKLAWILQYGTFNITGNGIQEGADLPDSEPFPLKYPDWLPHDFPVVEGETIVKHLSLIHI